MIKRLVILVAAILTSYLLGTSIFAFLNGDHVSTAYIIGSVLLIMVIIEGMTWEMDYKVQKDEMGRKIAGQAAVISYYILIVTMFVI